MQAVVVVCSHGGDEQESVRACACSENENDSSGTRHKASRSSKEVDVR